MSIRREKREFIHSDLDFWELLVIKFGIEMVYPFRVSTIKSAPQVRNVRGLTHIIHLYIDIYPSVSHGRTVERDLEA